MKDYLKFYKELNERQRTAVDAVDGPLLILAGPGTGKTQLLSVRAGSILSAGKGIRPENILILTYTNAAAKTMKERLARVIGLAGYEVEVGTFHSFANSIITESEETANYVGDRIQMEDVERMRAMEHILDTADGVEDIRPFRSPHTYIKELIQRISELKKGGISPAGLEAYLKDKKSRWAELLDEKYARRLRCLAVVYRKYEKLKEGKDSNIFDERGRYDFDDMILLSTEALKKEDVLRDEYRKQYRYVMVDEYQDTNDAQLEFLFTLLESGAPNLCCVGDDDQSIFRFQGASVGNFKILRERFGGSLKTIDLKDNYRSSEELIGISRKIIERIPPERRVSEKTLVSTRKWRDRQIAFSEFSTAEEELVYIVEKVRALKEAIAGDEGLKDEERAHPYNNIAVLVRKRDDILKIIDAFLKAGIPYATDGKEDISSEKRTRQLLDALELAGIGPAEREPKDLALYKVLSADYMRVPQADILRLISFANAARVLPGPRAPALLETLFGLFSAGKSPVKFADEKAVRRASAVIARLLSDAGTKTLHTMLLNFIKEAGIFKFILREYADNRILRIRELRALGSFVNMVKAGALARPGMRLDDFLAEMKTRKNHDMPIQGNLVTLTQEGVRVYTAHGSKGLEFHSVIIPFCLQNKNWPVRKKADMIQLPSDLLKIKQNVRGAEFARELALQDEIRLFYVAVTRARSNLIFTASPTEDSVSSFYLSELDIERQSPEYIDEEELIRKSLDVTDSSDPFIGAEEVLRDIVSNLSLNPTRINNYMNCRRKFLYNDVLKIPGSKKRSLVFGNCVHKALEGTYRVYMDTGRFPPFKFFEAAFESELVYQGVDNAMKQECLNKMKTVRAWFEKASKDPVMPTGLEKKLMVTIGDNIIFTGKYDKVEWADQAEGLVKILDYKTGKPDDHLKAIGKNSDLASRECDGYLRQLVCYKLLFEKDKRQPNAHKVLCGTLVFIEPVSANIGRGAYKKGEYVTKNIEISDDMVKSVEELIKDIWDGIKHLQFEKLKNRSEKDCARCDFDSICWG